MERRNAENQINLVEGHLPIYTYLDIEPQLLSKFFEALNSGKAKVEPLKGNNERFVQGLDLPLSIVAYKLTGAQIPETVISGTSLPEIMVEMVHKFNDLIVPEVRRDFNVAYDFLSDVLEVDLNQSPEDIEASYAERVQVFVKEGKDRGLDLRFPTYEQITKEPHQLAEAMGQMDKLGDKTTYTDEKVTQETNQQSQSTRTSDTQSHPDRQQQQEIEATLQIKVLDINDVPDDFLAILEFLQNFHTTLPQEQDGNILHQAARTKNKELYGILLGLDTRPLGEYLRSKYTAEDIQEVRNLLYRYLKTLVEEVNTYKLGQDSPVYKKWHELVAKVEKIPTREDRLFTELRKLQEVFKQKADTMDRVYQSISGNSYSLEAGELDFFHRFFVAGEATIWNQLANIRELGDSNNLGSIQNFISDLGILLNEISHSTGLEEEGIVSTIKRLYKTYKNIDSLWQYKSLLEERGFDDYSKSKFDAALSFITDERSFFGDSSQELSEIEEALKVFHTEELTGGLLTLQNSIFELLTLEAKGVKSFTNIGFDRYMKPLLEVTSEFVDSQPTETKINQVINALDLLIREQEGLNKMLDITKTYPISEMIVRDKHQEIINLMMGDGRDPDPLVATNGVEDQNTEMELSSADELMPGEQAVLEAIQKLENVQINDSLKAIHQRLLELVEESREELVLLQVKESEFKYLAQCINFMPAFFDEPSTLNHKLVKLIDNIDISERVNLLWDNFADMLVLRTDREATFEREVREEELVPEASPMEEQSNNPFDGALSTAGIKWTSIASDLPSMPRQPFVKAVQANDQGEVPASNNQAFGVGGSEIMDNHDLPIAEPSVSYDKQEVQEQVQEEIESELTLEVRQSEQEVLREMYQVIIDQNYVDDRSELDQYTNEYPDYEGVSTFLEAYFKVLKPFDLAVGKGELSDETAEAFYNYGDKLVEHFLKGNKKNLDPTNIFAAYGNLFDILVNDFSRYQIKDVKQYIPKKYHDKLSEHAIVEGASFTARGNDGRLYLNFRGVDQPILIQLLQWNKLLKLSNLQFEAVQEQPVAKQDEQEDVKALKTEQPVRQAEDTKDWNKKLQKEELADDHAPDNLPIVEDESNIELITKLQSAIGNLGQIIPRNMLSNHSLLLDRIEVNLLALEKDTENSYLVHNLGESLMELYNQFRNFNYQVQLLGKMKDSMTHVFQIYVNLMKSVGYSSADIIAIREEYDQIYDTYKAFDQKVYEIERIQGTRLRRYNIENLVPETQSDLREAREDLHKALGDSNLQKAPHIIKLLEGDKKDFKMKPLDQFYKQPNISEELRYIIDVFRYNYYLIENMKALVSSLKILSRKINPNTQLSRNIQEMYKQLLEVDGVSGLANIHPINARDLQNYLNNNVSFEPEIDRALQKYKVTSNQMYINVKKVRELKQKAA